MLIPLSPAPVPGARYARTPPQAQQNDNILSLENNLGSHDADLLTIYKEGWLL